MSEFNMEPYFDGGRWHARRWHVKGFSDFWFTSKEDADDAIKLALRVASRAEDDLSARIRDMLP